MITLHTIERPLGVLVLASMALLCIGVGDSRGAATTNWPTQGWHHGTPAGVGLDEKTLAGLDADFASGKYALDRQFPGLSLRRESLRAQVLARLCEYLRERSQRPKVR
jgi:hypothetical protein